MISHNYPTAVYNRTLTEGWRDLDAREKLYIYIYIYIISVTILMGGGRGTVDGTNLTEYRIILGR